jgi:hypothetical protein
MKGDGGFERLTRIEQRLERSIHRNMDELRKLRKLNDEVSSLRPSLRPCPFLAQDPLAEVEAGKAIEEEEQRANTSVQNEPIAGATGSAIGPPTGDQPQDEPAPSSIQNEPNDRAPKPDRPAHEGVVSSPLGVTIDPAEVTAPPPVEQHTTERGHDHAR